MVTDSKESGTGPVPPQVAAERVEIDVLRSTDLFSGRREVCIEHAGQLYRLRITRSGKLILQK
ncbi:MAG TPA: hemin uptake protein HemP [Pirellulales bacterium]